jgi:iron complex outermembrane receptor protein
MRGQVTASGTTGGTGYLISAYGVTSDGFRVVPETSARYDTLQAYGSFERRGVNGRITRAVGNGELSITANLLDLGAENPGSIPLPCPEGVTPAPEGCFSPYRGVHNTYLLFRTRKDITQQQGGVRWNGPLGGSGFAGDFSVYGVRRTVNNPLPSDLVDLSRSGGGLRASLSRSYATGLGALEWHAGADLDFQSDDRKEYENSGGQPAGNPPIPTLDQEESVRGVGIFLQTNLELPGGVVALAGLRYDSHNFEATDRIPATPENPDDSGTRTMSAFSPSVGVDVPVGATLNFFASVSTLFETPTTTELANQETNPGGFNPNLDPMDGVSFEAGLRGDVGSTAAFEVTAYQTSLNNELVPFEVEGSQGITYFRNAGSSKHRGVEVTLSAADRTGLVRGDLTYTYTDARFEDYVLGETDLADNRVPGVAPRRVQALFSLNPSLWFAQAVVTAMDGVPVNDLNTAEAPSYEVVDLRAGLQGFEFGNVVVAPWAAITNIFDEEYVASVAVNAFGGRFFEPGPARSFQVGVRATFGGN